MPDHTIYCSACDHEVVVTNLGALPAEWGGREVPDSEAAVCLDVGARCTGSMCPLFEIPGARMRARLEALRAPDPPPASGEVTS